MMEHFVPTSVGGQQWYWWGRGLVTFGFQNFFVAALTCEEEVEHSEELRLLHGSRAGRASLKNP